MVILLVLVIVFIFGNLWLNMLMTVITEPNISRSARIACIALLFGLPGLLITSFLYYNRTAFLTRADAAALFDFLLVVCAAAAGWLFLVALRNRVL